VSTEFAERFKSATSLIRRGRIYITRASAGVLDTVTQSWFSQNRSDGESPTKDAKETPGSSGTWSQLLDWRVESRKFGECSSSGNQAQVVWFKPCPREELAPIQS
jgi:hypothetical protein